MRRTAAIVLLVAALPAGCALVGYSFDGYGPASSGEGGSASSGQPTTDSSGTSGGSGWGGGSAGAGGGSPACTTPADCTPGTACQQPTCAGNVCGLADLPAGKACGNGDVCNGSGQCVHCLLATDCGISTDCAVFSCSNSGCSVSLAPIDMACSNGAGKCNQLGQCVVQCVGADQCPQTPDPCKAAVCNGGVCGIGNAPAITPCKGGADQCDGAGNCVDCVDNGGCDDCCVCINRACVQS